MVIRCDCANAHKLFHADADLTDTIRVVKVRNNRFCHGDTVSWELSFCDGFSGWKAVCKGRKLTFKACEHGVVF